MISVKKAQGKISVLILFAKKVNVLLKSCTYCGRIHDKKYICIEKDVAIKSFLKYTLSREASDDFTNRIEAFIKDIKSKEANKKEYSAVNIHDQDIYFKAKNEGIEEGFSQGISQGINQGAQQKAIETAKNLLSTLNKS